MDKMNLVLLPSKYAVTKFEYYPQTLTIPDFANFFSLTITASEISLVCEEELAPSGGNSEKGWRCIKLEGIIDFSLTGILMSILAPLAAAKIGIFAVSTFNTDYVLVKSESLDAAIAALSANNFCIVNMPF